MGNSAGLAYTQAGIQSIGAIGGAYANTKAYKDTERAKTNSIISNIGRELATFEYESSMLKQDMANLDSMFADKVSERELQAMKDEATLRAGSAETGTSGGTTSMAVQEAFMTEALDIGLINAERDKALSGTLGNLESGRMSVDNITSSLASESTAYTGGLLESLVLGGISGGSGLISSLPTNVVAKGFGFETETGTPIVDSTLTGSVVKHTTEYEEETIEEGDEI